MSNAKTCGVHASAAKASINARPRVARHPRRSSFARGSPEIIEVEPVVRRRPAASLEPRCKALTMFLQRVGTPPGRQLDAIGECFEAHLILCIACIDSGEHDDRNLQQ